MSQDEFLVEAVKSWVSRNVPGNSGLADQAAEVALRCRAGGASVGEASAEVREFVSSWISHPSRAGDVGSRALAS